MSCSFCNKTRHLLMPIVNPVFLWAKARPIKEIHRNKTKPETKPKGEKQ